MVTLSKRATPQQRRILRAVEGGIKNALHAHPELQYDPRLTASIAKRITGTLSSRWSEVLAAQAPSKKSVRNTMGPSNGPLATHIRRRLAKHGRGQRLSSVAGREGGAVSTPFPLHLLIKDLSGQIRPLLESGQGEKAQVLIEVLRTIDKLRFGP